MLIIKQLYFLLPSISWQMSNLSLYCEPRKTTAWGSGGQSSRFILFYQRKKANKKLSAETVMVHEKIWKWACLQLRLRLFVNITPTLLHSKHFRTWVVVFAYSGGSNTGGGSRIYPRKGRRSLEGRWGWGSALTQYFYCPQTKFGAR